MTAQTRATLYTYFQTNDKPTQAQFSDLIDSNLNLATASAQSIAADVSARKKLDVGGDFTVSGASTFGENITLANSANASVTGNITMTGGMVAGSPTGGNKGAGTINAVSVYSNGTLVTSNGIVNAGAANQLAFYSSASSTVGGTTAIPSTITATTPAVADTTTKLATTAFVNPGSLVTSNGYRKMPDGSILQWGSYTGDATAGNATAITFPVAFTTNVYSLTMSVGSNGTSIVGAWWDSITVNGFNGHSSVNSGVVGWKAIGK